MKNTEKEIIERFQKFDFDPNKTKENQIFNKITSAKAPVKRRPKRLVFAFVAVCSVLIAVVLVNKDSIHERQMTKNDVFQNAMHEAEMENLADAIHMADEAAKSPVISQEKIAEVKYSAANVREKQVLAAVEQVKIEEKVQPAQTAKPAPAKRMLAETGVTAAESNAVKAELVAAKESVKDKTEISERAALPQAASGFIAQKSRKEYSPVSVSPDRKLQAKKHKLDNSAELDTAVYFVEYKNDIEAYYRERIIQDINNNPDLMEAQKEYARNNFVIEIADGKVYAKVNVVGLAQAEGLLIAKPQDESMSFRIVSVQDEK
ncbi:MAG: hypothetical protein FWF00_05875 [Endomicrobia bacterium]|nr:hypothetical protein [Endomicrobiia bacterium]MCL2507194.1 hypothetical protein [Endomicrobiia bacterium]